MKLARRTFFQKAARGALVTFAGWMAARGANVLWAAEIAARPANEKPAVGAEPPLTPLTDRHTDSNVHYDNSHTDATVTGPDGSAVHGDIPHVDMSTHLDAHYDS